MIFHHYIAGQVGQEPRPAVEALEQRANEGGPFVVGDVAHDVVVDRGQALIGFESCVLTVQKLKSSWWKTIWLPQVYLPHFVISFLGLLIWLSKI